MKIFVKHILTIASLFLFALLSSAQENKKIQIIDADEARFDKFSGINARRLIGNVKFKHEEAFMYCDSAWYISSSNTMKAYGNVRIIQGDSVNIYGKFLSYDGDTKMAKMRDSVVLIHNESRLNTDSLNFDRTNNIGYFFNYGEIHHENIQLSSKRGYYYPNNRNYFAKDSVRLIHPDYTIFADTLKYNIDNKITHFLGRTHIISDSARIECFLGWYNTQNNTSAFGKNSILYMKSQTIKADSLYYDKNTSSGKAWKNIHMSDTIEQFAGLGHYAEYNQKTGHSFITDSALVMYYENSDTTYIHADTIFMNEVGDSAKNLLAYFHVQIFKQDMQGRCDSLIYYENDAFSTMFGKPILWSGESQITADTIKMLMRNNVAEKIIMNEDAFIAMQDDSIRFSQISGKGIIANIKDKQLYRIQVLSNAETIYYARDDETNDIIGVNKETSSCMNIYRDDGKIQRIDFIGDADGVFFPDKDVKPEDMRLRNFVWLEKLRPKTLRDIFIREK